MADVPTQLNPSLWVEQYGDYLYRYALYRLRDAGEAEEVVQETFVAALRAQDQYSGKGAERAWLLGILKRKIVDLVRQRAHLSHTGGNALGDDISEAVFDQKGRWREDPRLFGSDPSSWLERQEFWQIFRSCLASLPGRQADTFSLREIDGQSSEEICKELHITPSNLWVLLHRARLGLLRCMKSRWNQESSG